MAVSFNNYETISNHEAQTFTIDIDQTVNVTFYINGTPVQNDTSVTTASYTNSTAISGSSVYNVTAYVENANVMDSYQWNWTVLVKPVETPTRKSSGGGGSFYSLPIDQQNTTEEITEDVNDEEGIEEGAATPTEVQLKSPPSEPMYSIQTTEVEEDAPASEVEEPLDIGSILKIIFPLIALLGLAFILKRSKD